jgi:hypothetical protein
MLGWHISVYRQGGDSAAPAQAIREHYARIAVWQTGLGGLDWIEEAVRSNGHFLGGDGYPYRYNRTSARSAADHPRRTTPCEQDLAP